MTQEEFDKISNELKDEIEYIRKFKAHLLPKQGYLYLYHAMDYLNSMHAFSHIREDDSQINRYLKHGNGYISKIKELLK